MMLTKEYRRKWNALEGEDIDWLLKNSKVMQFATDRTGLSSERGNEIQSELVPEGRVMIAMDEKEKRLEELYANGQITVVEIEVGNLKLIMQDQINMFREDRRR